MKYSPVQTRERPWAGQKAGSPRCLRWQNSSGCEVESFRREQQVSFFSKLMVPTQAHVKVHVIGAQTRITGDSNGAFIGDMVVAVDFTSRQQIERMPAVVRENRR